MVYQQFNKELASVVHDIICTCIWQSKYPTAYTRLDQPTTKSNHHRLGRPRYAVIQTSWYGSKQMYLGVWHKSFLSDWMLQVKLAGAMSKPAHVITRVPQGGFKPLFDIFINDIGETLPSNVVTTSKCADDCTLYQLVPTAYVSFLQDVVCLLESWASHNKMELNAQTTKEMWIFSKKNQQLAVPSVCKWCEARRGQ